MDSPVKYPHQYIPWQLLLKIIHKELLSVSYICIALWKGPFVLNCFSVAVTKHGAKSMCEKKGVIWPTWSDLKHFKTEGNQGKNLNRCWGKKTTKKKALFWILFLYLISLICYVAQGHLPSGSTAYNGPESPTSIFEQEIGPLTCLQVKLMEAIPQLRLPLPVWPLSVPKWQKVTSVPLDPQM